MMVSGEKLENRARKKKGCGRRPASDPRSWDVCAESDTKLQRPESSIGGLRGRLRGSAGKKNAVGQQGAKPEWCIRLIPEGEKAGAWNGKKTSRQRDKGEKKGSDHN